MRIFHWGLEGIFVPLIQIHKMVLAAHATLVSRYVAGVARLTIVLTVLHLE